MARTRTIASYVRFDPYDFSYSLEVIKKYRVIKKHAHERE